MKKLITLIFLTFTLTTLAQRNSGFKVGYNIGWVSSTISSAIPNYDAMYETSTLNKLHFGYSWNIKLSGKYSLQTDLIYNWKGNVTNVKDSYVETAPNPYGGSSSVFSTYEFECLSLPITLNYMVTPHIFVELGGEFSLAPFNSPDNNFDFGIVTGAGYSTKYVDVSLRYIHSLTPHTTAYDTYSFVSDSNGVLISSTSKHTEYTDKFRTFQISLTIPVFKYFTRRE